MSPLGHLFPLSQTFLCRMAGDSSPPPPVFSAVLCFPVSICRFLLLFPEKVLLLHRRQTRFPFTSAPRRERMSVASQWSRPSASGAELRGRRVTFPAGGPPPPPPPADAQLSVPSLTLFAMGWGGRQRQPLRRKVGPSAVCLALGWGGVFQDHSVRKARVSESGFLSPRAEMAVKTAVDERGVRHPLTPAGGTGRGGEGANAAGPSGRWRALGGATACRGLRRREGDRAFGSFGRRVSEPVRPPC